MTTGDDDRVFTGSWVIETNLRPLCESVAHFTGYGFDDRDWQPIDAALPATDAERHDGWYAYPLSGRVPLTLLVAGDPRFLRGVRPVRGRARRGREGPDRGGAPHLRDLDRAMTAATGTHA